MGLLMSVPRQIREPDITPLPKEKPTFDPHFGFKEPREKRVMIASDVEMMAAKVDQEDRDYCAHLLLEYWRCRTDKSPFYYQCADQKHAATWCEFEDYVLRMKEYEREKRLRIREKRIAAAAGMTTAVN